MEQWCRRMVLREAALLHLHKAALQSLSLRTLELVVSRVAVVKGAPKFPNNPARKLLRVLAQRALAPRPPGKVSYVLLTRYLIPR